MGDVYLNARFRRAPLTGVQRYAHELSRRIPDLVALEPPPVGGRGALGHLWEQTGLLLRSKSGVLWSPCNVGPVFHPRHVLTIHDLAVFDHPQGFSRQFVALYRELLPLLAARALKILTVSRFSAQRIQTVLGVESSRIHITPNAVAAQFCPQSPEHVAAAKRHFGISGRYVLCVGSRDPRKNTDLLRRLCRESAEALDVEFVFVGGARRAIFADDKTPAGSPREKWLGYVEDDWLPALYTGAELFLFPSWYEGFGIPVLEALACGTPCLVSDIAVLKELAGVGVCFAPPTSVGAWAEMFEKLLSAPKLVVARSKCNFFSWDNTAQEVRRVLTSVE